VEVTRRIAEYVGRHRTERVDDVGIEVLASPGASHLDGGVGSPAAVEHLDSVSEMEQAHRLRDVLPADPGGDARAVPPREHLLKGVTHVGSETETFSHPGCGEAVR